MDKSIKHNELEAVAGKTENPGKAPGSSRKSIWVPGVLEEIGWENPEQRDNVDRLIVLIDCEEQQTYFLLYQIHLYH